MIAEPPFDPGVNEIVALPLPAAADKPVGPAGADGNGGVEDDGYTTKRRVDVRVGFGNENNEGGAFVCSDSTCMSPAVPLMACVAVTGNQKWIRSLVPDLTQGNVAYPPDIKGAAHSPTPGVLSTLLKLLISQYTSFASVGLISCSPAGISTRIRYVAFHVLYTSV